MVSRCCTIDLVRATLLRYMRYLPDCYNVFDTLLTRCGKIAANYSIHSTTNTLQMPGHTHHNSVCSYHHCPVLLILHIVREKITYYVWNILHPQRCWCLQLPAVGQQLRQLSLGNFSTHTAEGQGRGTCPDLPQTEREPPQMENPAVNIVCRIGSRSILLT